MSRSLAVPARQRLLVIALACLPASACTTQLFEGPPRDDSEVAVVRAGPGTQIDRVRSDSLRDGRWIHVNGSVRALPGVYTFELEDTFSSILDVPEKFGDRYGKHGEVEARLEAGERYVAEWDEYEGGGIEIDDDG
ncbi:MAG: hypothetical protein H6825_00340 [Planctomycetes bacterium]|nr:hypothetical protein [Planctomycetota bacterium]